VLFGHESISTYTRLNFTVWLILAFQAGLLNMGGFMACHSFVSHVTGFATMFGYELNRVHYRAASGMLIVPFFFLLGAMLSGYLVDVRLQMQKAPKYYIVLGVLFFLLLFIAIAGFNGFFGKFGNAAESTEDYTLLAFICLACGVQNGMVTLVSRSVVRTTHLTGVTTDLGIGIVRLINRNRLKIRNPDEVQANFMRIGIIVCFILGSAVGVKIFEYGQFRGFLLPTAITGILFFSSLYLQVLRPRHTGKP
jgi:uncharacterized membrane protein YoaK (UPF0700 family)